MYLKINQAAIVNLLLRSLKSDFIKSLSFEFNLALKENQDGDGVVHFDLNSENTVMEVLTLFLSAMKAEEEKIALFVRHYNSIYIKFDEKNNEELKRLKNLLLCLKILYTFAHFSKLSTRHDLINLVYATDCPPESVYKNVIPQLKVLLLLFKNSNFDILNKKGIVKKYNLNNISKSQLSLFVPKAFSRNSYKIIKAIKNEGLDLPTAEDIQSAIKSCDYDFNIIFEILSLEDTFGFEFNVEDFENRLKNMHNAKKWLKEVEYKLFDDHIHCEKVEHIELCYNYEYFSDPEKFVVEIIEQEEVEKDVVRLFMIDKLTGRAYIWSENTRTEAEPAGFKLISKNNILKYIKEESDKLKMLKSKLM